MEKINPEQNEVESVPPERNESPIWPNSVRYIALVGLVAVITFLAFFMRGSISLIIISALVAYLLNPIVRFLHNKLHISRNLAVIIVYILLIILIIVAVSIIIPKITQGVQTFFTRDYPQVISSLEEYVELIETEIDAIVIRTGVNVDLSAPLDSIREWLHSVRAESFDISMLIPDIGSALRRVLSVSTNIAGQIMAGLILAVTAILSSIHLCRDGHKLPGFVTSLFEEKYQPEVRTLLSRISGVWGSYFTGELKLMLWVGLITFVVYFILGIRWALVLGIIAGFCEVIPNIGPILATVPAMISALIFGSTRFPINNLVVALLVVAASVLVQQTENIFLVPHIMGNALKIHPVVILLGIMVLSSRLGLVGAVFAAPIIALAKELLSFIIRKIKKEDPFPDYHADLS